MLMTSIALTKLHYYFFPKEFPKSLSLLPKHQFPYLLILVQLVQQVLWYLLLVQSHLAKLLLLLVQRHLVELLLQQLTIIFLNLLLFIFLQLILLLQLLFLLKFFCFHLKDHFSRLPLMHCKFQLIWITEEILWN